MFAKIGKAASLAMLATVLAGPSAWWAAPARGDEKPKEEPAKAAKEDAKEAAAKPKIAVFRLAGDVTESPADETFSFGGPASVSLKDLVARMKKAGEDPEVKAVVILHEGGTVGTAQIEELRQAMAKVRAAGKEVYAHADSLSMGEYVLPVGRLAAERRADGRPVDHRPLRRGALPARAARQARRPAGLPHLRRLQERRRDLHARRPEPRGRRDAELAARRHLRHLRRADRQGPRRGARQGPRAGSTPARTPPRRRRRPA